MTIKGSFRLKPEDEELHQKRQEFGDLEKQLIERELQLINLRRELATFERLYTEKVGTRYAELDEVEAQIARLFAEYYPGDVDAQNVARDACNRAEESKSNVAGIVFKESPRFSATPSLKSLYRDVAKRIHPDLAVDQTDCALRQRLMAEANRAYENGDEARLRAILDEYESSPDSVFGDGIGVELIRIIRKIAQVKRRLAEIDREIKDITESELSELKGKVDEGAGQGRDLLNEMAATVNSRIEERRTALRKMSEDRSK